MAEPTEEWLDGIENRLEYGKWYCGHYHTEKKIDKLEIMFENFRVFCGDRHLNAVLAADPKYPVK